MALINDLKSLLDAGLSVTFSVEPWQIPMYRVTVTNSENCKWWYESSSLEGWDNDLIDQHIVALIEGKYT